MTNGFRSTIFLLSIWVILFVLDRKWVYTEGILGEFLGFISLKRFKIYLVEKNFRLIRFLKIEYDIDKNVCRFVLML